jgi:hypothetical protein
VKEIVYNPNNRDDFSKLLAFVQVLFLKCAELNVQPVAYGSLAYAFYTKDETIDIHDIDLLVPESSFLPIIAAVKNLPDVTYEETTYHSLKLFRDGVKISFDAIEEYYRGLPRNFVKGKINGIAFRLVSRNALKEVYKRAAETIPTKKEQYAEKLNTLNQP